MSHPQSLLPVIQATLLTFRRHIWLWITPTILMTVAATVYGLVRPEVWSCSQALVVREEALANDERLGRFESVDSMKVYQEVVLEVARNRDVIATTLKLLGPPAGHAAPTQWPTAADIDAMEELISVRAPKGAEFGRTEVIYLSVGGPTRQAAIERNAALCEQIQDELAQLRNAKATSVIVELEESLRLANQEWNAATDRLEAMERTIGNDLGELRSLNESGAGNSNLRSALNEVDAELRQTTSDMEANQQLHALLERAQDDPEELLATPERLLEAQPGLERLKDGLVDAQLRTAALRGKMQDGHPLIQAAVRAEQKIRQDLHAEIASALRGLEGDRRIIQQRWDTLNGQHEQLQARLNRIAGMRVRYSNLVDDVRQRSEIVQQTQGDLADMRASRNASHTTSLLTRFNDPVVGDRPEGPQLAIITGAGLAGGLATGVGLVLLIFPPLGAPDPRWAGYLAAGRRATDRILGRRASDRGEMVQLPSHRQGGSSPQRRREETPDPACPPVEMPLTAAMNPAADHVGGQSDAARHERRQGRGRRADDH